MASTPLNLDENSRNSPAYLLAGAKDLFKLGSLLQAERDITRALTLDNITRTEIIEALMLRGEVRLADKKRRDAIRDWEAVLAVDATNERAHLLLDGGEIEQQSPILMATPLQPLSPASPSIMVPSNPPATIVRNFSENPAPAPGLIKPFKIRVTRRGTDKIVGHLRQRRDSGHVEVKDDWLNADQFSAVVSEPAPFAIKFHTSPIWAGDGRNPDEDRYPCLGWFQGGNGSHYLWPNPHGKGHAYLARTGHTPPGAKPTAVGIYSSPLTFAESSIWYYDSSTRQLTAQWVNLDDSKYPNDICVAPTPGDSTLVLVGNFEAFKKSDSGSERFFLVDLTPIYC